jgi:hypothetical protein
MEILQVDNRECSTLVYLAYTTPNTADWNNVSSWMNFGDKTYIRIDGSNKRYQMISTINMPICSEAENKRMLFDRRNQRHQFILEFEKIPEGKNFDIIEDIDDHNASNCIDIDGFISEYPVKEFGSYVVDGTTISYVKFKNIVINIVPFLVDEYGKYYNMNINIQNYSNKSILFNPNYIFTEGYKFKKSQNKGVVTYIPELVKLELLSYAEYDKIVKKKQRWNNFWVALGEGLAAYSAGMSYSTTTYSGSAYTSSNARASGYLGNTYGYANAYGSSYSTAYGKSTTRTYNGAAAYAAQQRANENYANFVENQRQIRQQLGDGYAKLNTIPAETEYSGYFNIKHKKIDQLVLRIVIDGEIYPFTFD